MKKFYLLFALALLGACVDKDYNLSKIETDDVTFGDVVSGPLGKGTISVVKILNVEENEEIRVEDNRYVIRYGGEMEVTFSRPAMNNVTYNPQSAPLTLPWAGTVTVPSNHSVGAATTVTTTLEPYPDDVKSISKVELQLGARLFIEIDLVDFSVTGTGSTLDLDITFPAGYTMTRISPEAAVFNGQELDYDGVNIGGVSTIVLELEPTVLEVGTTADQIQVDASLNFVAGDQVTVGASPRLVVKGRLENLNHKVIYGEFDPEPMTIPTRVIDTEGLNDIFTGDDNRLSFQGTYITLESQNNVGVPLTASLDVASRRGAETRSAEITGVSIAEPLTYAEGMKQGLVWISSAAGPANYTFVQNDQLDALLEIMPNAVTIGGEVTVGTRATEMFYPSEPASTMQYSVVVPLAPAQNFSATLEQKMENVFNEELIDYLFSGGSVDLLGTITNSLPLDLDMTLVIVKEDGVTEVGIDMGSKKIESSDASGNARSTDFLFTIKEADMAKMENARHIVMRFVAKGNATTAGQSLKPTQQVELTLKFNKRGGISL